MIDVEDPVENDDDAAVIELPFPIQYYGNTFNTMTISTNGYVAMGSQTDLSLPRNWIIPSPLGPNNMIAPYWDELRTVGDANISYYYDSDTGALIVEFFRMRAHEPEFANTFQVIFYDTALHPTPTGDNMFVFQYNSCNHSEGGMRYDMPYWTTGIENGAQSDGLQLAFLNILHPSVTSIGEGRAILFTAAMHTTDRNLTGTVVSLADSSPIQEALVYTNPLNVVVTDSTGYFCLPLQTSLPMHVYFEADCFNPVSRLLDPLQDEITNVTVALSRPEFILNTETLIDTLSENETASFTVSVSNPGDGILRSALTFDVHQPTMALEKQGHRWIRELDETWTRRPGFQLSTESSGYLGITHNGSNFWISGTNQDNPNNAHLLYLYTSNGELIRSCNQPVPEANRSALGMQDLAWEDGYLYGADGNVLYEMELNNGNFTVTNQLAVPVSPVTYLAVDSYRGLFWLGSTHTYITGVNLNGAVEYSIFNGSYSFAGGDLLPSAQLNENLALLSWNMATHQYRAIEVVPESGEVLPLADFTGGLLDNRPTGACITHDMQLSAWIFATIAHFEEVDSVLLWEIGPYDDWVSLPEAYIEVDPGETFDFPVSAYSSVLPPMTYTLDLVFDHNACSDNSNRVMIQMVIIDSDTPEELHDRPLEWALDAIWPNPFNPTTQIRYGLKETTTVDVQIFDILGRQVAILAHETQQAGWYTIPFTASNLSSGLYFVQINAGPLHETRKLVLLK